MNKINTIVDKRFNKFINCKITNAGTGVLICHNIDYVIVI